jgi:glycosyltransferase involved in cell wall biosynthesis
MGELCGRMSDMDAVYRGMDVVLTPHRIVTRVTGEALSVGTPVIASKGCKVTPFLCDPHDPYSVAKAIKDWTKSDKGWNRQTALEEAKKFDLGNYSLVINEIYKEIMGGKNI